MPTLLDTINFGALAADGTNISSLSRPSAYVTAFEYKGTACVIEFGAIVNVDSTTANQSIRFVGPSETDDYAVEWEVFRGGVDDPGSLAGALLFMDAASLASWDTRPRLMIVSDRLSAGAMSGSIRFVDAAGSVFSYGSPGSIAVGTTTTGFFRAEWQARRARIYGKLLVGDSWTLLNEHTFTAGEVAAFEAAGTRTGFYLGSTLSSGRLFANNILIYQLDSIAPEELSLGSELTPVGALSFTFVASVEAAFESSVTPTGGLVEVAVGGCYPTEYNCVADESAVTHVDVDAQVMLDPSNDCQPVAVVTPVGD